MAEQTDVVPMDHTHIPSVVLNKFEMPKKKTLAPIRTTLKYYCIIVYLKKGLLTMDYRL